ncbi:uncharacterized protein LOC142415003 [Mycteria americana]|uniref:uncharacterized protein LOC142415003 n=1 Tax=Mycteria americana TaxID=33587 RepID=UPI003F5887F1
MPSAGQTPNLAAAAGSEPLACQTPGFLRQELPSLLPAHRQPERVCRLTFALGFCLKGAENANAALGPGLHGLAGVWLQLQVSFGSRHFTGAGRGAPQPRGSADGGRAGRGGAGRSPGRAPPAAASALPPPPAGPPRAAPPLNLYLYAVAAALGGAALGALLVALLRRRRKKAEPLYAVAFHSTTDVTRLDTDVEVLKSLDKETKAKTETSNDTCTMKDNGHDSICIRKNPEYENLVNAMESEYEIEQI